MEISMKWSTCLLKTQKDIKKDCLSYELLVKAGLVKQLSTGIFTYHTFLLKAIRKLEAIIREEMEGIGYQEILMSMVHKRELWQESGRWDKMDDSLLKFKNRSNQDFCLAGTHEEAVVDYVRGQIRSYKDLNVKAYQIQTKFRDEIRARYGLIRGKEFIMKDAYSFSKNEEEATILYHEMVEAYKRIFDRLGLDYIVVEAEAGAIGGKKTHEFHLVSDIGDDDLFICEDCGFSGNREILGEEENCFHCNSSKLQWKKGIELGHCFLLGTEYTEKMDLKVNHEDSKDYLVHMGCYGIGVTRIIQAIFENSHDDKGLIWNKELSSFSVHLADLSGKSEEVKAYAQDIYDFLVSQGIDVFWDDRSVRTGVKMNDMDSLGFTHQVIVSKRTMESGLYEFCLRSEKDNKELLSKDDLLKRLK